jgi:HK97 family phage portal protein
MAVVQTDSGLVNVNAASKAFTSNPFVNFFEGDGKTLAQIYKTQPEVRACVDFLSRNIGQLPLHAFQRLAENDRQRLSDTPLSSTLDNPAPNVTKTRWLTELVSDLAVHGNSYHIKVRAGEQVALVRVPPSMVEIEGNWLRPDTYIVKGTMTQHTYKRDQVLHIQFGYNPEDPRTGLSPLETLRNILAEQSAAGKYREAYWRNAARMGGIIERPAGSPSWSDTARARFKADWDAQNTGTNASGRTAILEEGMTFKPSSFSARDSQYLETFQLTREVVATAYGIPIGLLGLGSFTYASLSEQHRQLYADCLAPWLVLIQEELEQQLLPEFGLAAGVYLEFNIDAKLQGSLLERAQIFQATVGAPYVTRNEARAKLNLPSIEGGDELVTPLNVLTGGQASPQDSVPTERLLETPKALEITSQVIEPEAAKAVTPRQRAERIRQFVAARDRKTEKTAAVIKKALERQRRSTVSKLGAKAAPASVFDRRRFEKELAADLDAELTDVADTFGTDVASKFGVNFSADGMQNFNKRLSRGAAQQYALALDAAIDDAWDAEDPEAAMAEAFDQQETKAGIVALSLVTAVATTARAEAAGSVNAFKTWVVTAPNPRASHAALDGVTIPFGEAFSNGLRWPGDSSSDDADEKAGCTCMLDFDFETGA